MNKKTLLNKWREEAEKLKQAAESELVGCEYCGRAHSDVLAELLYSCIEQLETVEIGLTPEEKEDRKFIHDIVQTVRDTKIGE